MSPYSSARAPRRGDSQGILRHLDWLTVILYFLLVTAGVISIYAASYDYDNASIFSFDEFSGKQITWVGLSFVLGLVLLLVDSRMYETYAYPIYIAMMALLVVTIFIAPDIKGSRSWLVLGSMSLQPAEFSKFATALALAKLFSTYGFNLNASPSNYVKALFIIFLPVVLILAQKETGSALVYMSLFFVLYREGMSGLILSAALLAVVIFVLSVKYTETMILGIPAGEFSVFCLLMVLMSGDARRICEGWSDCPQCVPVVCRRVACRMAAVAGRMAVAGLHILRCQPWCGCGILSFRDAPGKGRQTAGHGRCGGGFGGIPVFSGDGFQPYDASPAEAHQGGARHRR